MGRCDAAGVILFCVYALILFCNRSITCTIKPGNADHRFLSKVVDRLAQTVNHLFQQCKDPAAKAFCPRCFPNLFNTQTLVPLQGFASDRASCRFPDSSTRTTHPSCTAQRCRTFFRSTVKPTSYPLKRRTTKGSLWLIIAAPRAFWPTKPVGRWLNLSPAMPSPRDHRTKRFPSRAPSFQHHQALCANLTSRNA